MALFKTIIRWLALVALAVVILAAAYLGVKLYRLPSVAGLSDPAMNMTIQVPDWQGKLHPFVVGPENPWWTPEARIPKIMKWAVVVAEDANFYQHEGVDIPALKEALKYDLEQKRFARGASTITQQTAKNLYLGREKTIIRKIEEIYLARQMEQKLVKGRILELYLNVIELGPMVYGVGHGARYYFNKPASDLTPRQSAFLAAMLPGPRKVYNPYRHLDQVLKRSDMILHRLHQQKILSDAEYRRALAETPDITGMQKKVDQSFTGKVKRFFRNLFDRFR